jgi:hypothetical protein
VEEARFMPCLLTSAKEFIDNARIAAFLADIAKI